MAAVYLKILLLSAMREPYRTDVFHGSSVGASACGACLAECIYHVGVCCQIKVVCGDVGFGHKFDWPWHCFSRVARVKSCHI